ncbi:hypothetical protein IE53DRAFT_240842 [Violaceomyces palustris]|uniref:Uncharacterized protein n=1 Tax=Violaceomyces palustris TaxID=1673888 RepID=A0ACD0P4M0_9BASI|nr:hypothetical protein IE53DRAFT_240842 [Violaceomyces palustris]
MDQQSFSRLDPSLSLAAYSLSHLQQQQQQPSAEGDTTLSPSHSKSNELPPNSNDLGRSSPEMHASDHVDVAAPPEPAPDPAPPLERNHESAVPESSYPAEVSPTDTPAVAHEPNVSETENAPQGQSTAPDEATGHGAPIDGQNKQDSIDYGNESHPSDENPPESELPPPTATGEDHQESVPDQASLKAPSGQRANQWDASQGVPETPDRKRGGTKLPALSRRIGDDLKEVYASASFIVNFAATHLNNLTSPRPDEVQIAISKALSITQNLTGLLSAPDQSKSGKVSVPLP